MPPAVGNAHHARHDRVGHLDRQLDRTHPRRDARELAAGDPEARGVRGVEVRGAARVALHEHAKVVHPGVVRPEIATADENHLAVGARGTLERRTQAFDVGGDGLGGKLDPARRGAEHLGDARLERTQVDAVGTRLEDGKAESARIRPEGVAVRSRAQQEVEEALGTATGCEQGQDLRRVPAVDRRGGRDDVLLHALHHDEVVERGDVGTLTLTGDDRRQAEHRLPLGRVSRWRIEGGRRIRRDVADRELPQDHVVVRLLQG